MMAKCLRYECEVCFKLSSTKFSTIRVEKQNMQEPEFTVDA